ncbi:MAG: hypothetical protein LBT38_12510 [Deltaproteobacteria bacterium]|jgi:hypothetical protein|nr:hypothetical protein [Deltaproteobacteria bacterium]
MLFSRLNIWPLFLGPLKLSLKALGFIFFFLALAALSPSQARAQDQPLGLGYVDPLGAIIIQAALDNGYFSEEGLTVTPILADNLSSLLGKKTIIGGVLDYQALFLASQGQDLVFSAGLYSGFLELAGKEVGANQIAIATVDPLSGPAVAAAKYYQSLGHGSSQDIKWIKVPEDGLVKAVTSGQANVLTRWQLAKPDPKEPWASLTYKAHGPHAHGLASGSEFSPDGYQIIHQAKAHLPKAPEGAKHANPHAGHTADHHFYQAFVVLENNFVTAQKAKATAITRALIRGARWVGDNKEKAARLGLDKKFWTGSQDDLEGEIGRYMWMPGVSQAREHLKTYIHEGLKNGGLPAKTEEKSFFEKVFVQLLPDFS